jgi:anti-anti-sigma factor
MTLTQSSGTPQSGTRGSGTERSGTQRSGTGRPAGEAATVTLQERVLSDRHGPVHVIKVIGRLNWKTAGELTTHLRRETTGSDTILDLRPMTSLDSSGTGTLINAARFAQASGQHLVILTDSAAVGEVLAATGLSEAAPVMDSLRPALRWLSSIHVVPHDPTRAAA